LSARITPLRLEAFEQLPKHARRCVFWEVDPATLGDQGHLADPEFEKEAWLSMVMLEWGSCGRVIYLDSVPAGYALYVKDGKLVYHYNWFERERTNIVSNQPLPTGESTVTMEFAYDGGGLGKGGEAVIGINGKEVGRARVPNTVAGRFGIDTFGVGSDTGSPVTDAYTAPFPFTGKVKRVDFELGPQNLSKQDETKLHDMQTMFVGAHE